MLRASPARARRIAISSITNIVPAFGGAGEWVAAGSGDAVAAKRRAGMVAVHDQDLAQACRRADTVGGRRGGRHLPGAGSGGEKAPGQAPCEARGEKEGEGGGCSRRRRWGCSGRGGGET